MIDDLLMSAKLGTNTVITVPEDISLSDTVRTAIASTRELGFSTAMEFEEARVVADPEHLRHVIRNLVINAHRHGRTPVAVRSRVHGNRCQIGVVDQGPGVPVEDEPWLFAKVPTERWSRSMMPPTLTERRKQQTCEHPDRISTVNFGLVREVCLVCGSIRMRKAADAEP
jgi:K+-sensing histidine kinase KdpD